jgi:hypothetical protein
MLPTDGYGVMVTVCAGAPTAGGDLYLWHSFRVQDEGSEMSWTALDPKGATSQPYA